MSFSPMTLHNIYFTMYLIEINKMIVMRYHTSRASSPALMDTIVTAAYAGITTQTMQTGSVLILNSM
jgi:hypothetical protein